MYTLSHKFGLALPVAAHDVSSAAAQDNIPPVATEDVSSPATAKYLRLQLLLAGVEGVLKISEMS